MSLRQRKPGAPAHSPTTPASDLASSPPKMSSPLAFLQRQPLWIILAVASGACAGLNGVFAKLTTTSLTSTLSSHIATALGLSADNTPIDLAVRGFFFGMNLLFNALMWALFTAALTRGDSTTRVSIINVSANFMITAVLGAAIFGERLPPLWWVGAGLLAVGNVVIGRREEGAKPGGSVGLDESREEAEGLMHGQEEEDLVELDDTGDREERERVRKGEDADAPL